MNKKSMIIIGAALLVVVIVAIAATGSSVSKTDGAYNYGNMETEDHFTSYTGYGSTPSAGNVYVVMDVVLENQNYKNGISNNPLYFELEIGGIGYKFPLSSKEIVSVLVGAKITFKLAFEVPSDVNISNASLKWNGIGKVVHDSNLAL